MSYGISFIYNISIDVNSDEDKLELWSSIVKKVSEKG